VSEWKRNEPAYDRQQVQHGVAKQAQWLQNRREEVVFGTRCRGQGAGSAIATFFDDVAYVPGLPIFHNDIVARVVWISSAATQSRTVPTGWNANSPQR